MQKFEFPNQTFFYRGKVRDVYGLDSGLLVMLSSNRISAFDVILPREIPYKGQILNQLSAFMLEATRTVCPNWLLDVPAPAVSIGNRCTPFKMEMVVRGHLVGHAWRIYVSGSRKLCGAVLPEGLREYDPLPHPIITPSTKADQGHDEDITAEELMSKGIISSQHWEEVSRYALALFSKGKEMASARGLILADTKYEFGLWGNEVVLMDEVHTPDSSRYFYAEGFEDRQSRGEKQQQLSKEFVREWLMANGFMGKAGQQVPQMTDAWVEQISRKYIELFERMTNQKFIPQDISDEETRQRIISSLHQLSSSTRLP